MSLRTAVWGAVSEPRPPTQQGAGRPLRRLSVPMLLTGTQWRHNRPGQNSRTENDIEAVVGVMNPFSAMRLEKVVCVGLDRVING